MPCYSKQKRARHKTCSQAADNGDRAGAELLLAAGADPKEKKHHGESTDSRKLDFKTPFHIAVEAENYTLAAILLRAAQGINGLDEQGWTPLMVGNTSHKTGTWCRSLSEMVLIFLLGTKKML